MNFVEQLQYLHDKLNKFPEAGLNLYLLRGIKLLISNPKNTGYLHEVVTEIGNVTEACRMNRWGKDITAHCRDIDVMYSAQQVFYGALLTHNAIGTKNEASVAERQGERIAEGKKVLDLL